jgi:tetratricopeptide (TPR) repeat protein
MAWGLSRYWLNTAQEAASRNSWSTADRFLARYMRVRGETADALMLAARIDAASGRRHQAVQLLERFPKSDVRASQAAYYRGELLFELDRAAAAERAARESLELETTAVGPRRLLFELFSWEGRDFEARKLVEGIYATAPDDVKLTLLIHLFNVDFSRHNVKEAAERLRRFISADADDVDAITALAALEAEATRFDRAQSELERVLRLRPQQILSRQYLIQLHVQRGQFEPVKRLLDGWPADQRDWRYARGAALFAQMALNDHAAAAQGFEEVLRQTPDDHQIRHRLGTSLIALGQKARGEREVERALRTRKFLDRKRVAELLDKVNGNMNSADRRFEVGSFYEDLGYADRAREWYRMALAFDATHQASLDGMERLHDKPRG